MDSEKTFYGRHRLSGYLVVLGGAEPKLRRRYNILLPPIGRRALC